MKLVENFRTLKSLLGSGQLKGHKNQWLTASCSLADQEEHPACLSLNSLDQGSRLGFFLWSEQQVWFIVLPRCGDETQGYLTGTRNELHTSFLLPFPGPGFCCHYTSVFPMQAPSK